MKRKMGSRLVVLVVACTLGACQGGMVRADAIDGLVREVADRHDAYVAADVTATAVQRSVWQRSTALLRAVLAEAMKR